VFIPCTAQQAWNLLSTPGYLTLVNCYVAENKSDRWQGPGDTDTFSYRSGRQFQRRVEFWRPEQGIGVSLHRIPPHANRVTVHFLFNPVANGIHFSAEIGMDTYRKVPRPLWPVFCHIFLEPLFRKYLSALLSGYHQYLTTGKPVEANQFGRLRPFS
jgi:hypothetical protein